MGYKHKTGADYTTGGSWCKAPGTYHLVVEHVECPPLDKNQQPMADAAFRWSFKILAGTDPAQVGKTCDILFFEPKLGGKDDGAFARKKIDRALIAVGLLDPSEKEKEQEFEVEAAIGRQCVAEFEMDDKGKYLQLAFANIYHVDDPEAARSPKNEELLKQIPAKYRRVGSREPKKEEPPKGNVDLGAI